jgi:hypothetical protein
MPARRFPPPWSIDELEPRFVVKDSAGQKLAYVYFEDEPGRGAGARRLQARTIRDDLRTRPSSFPLSVKRLLSAERGPRQPASTPPPAGLPLDGKEVHSHIEVRSHQFVETWSSLQGQVIRIRAKVSNGIPRGGSAFGYISSWLAAISGELERGGRAGECNSIAACHDARDCERVVTNSTPERSISDDRLRLPLPAPAEQIIPRVQRAS